MANRRLQNWGWWNQGHKGGEVVKQGPQEQEDEELEEDEERIETVQAASKDINIMITVNNLML